MSQQSRASVGKSGHKPVIDGVPLGSQCVFNVHHPSGWQIAVTAGEVHLVARRTLMLARHWELREWLRSNLHIFRDDMEPHPTNSEAGECLCELLCMGCASLTFRRARSNWSWVSFQEPFIHDWKVSQCLLITSWVGSELTPLTLQNIRATSVNVATQCRKKKSK